MGDELPPIMMILAWWSPRNSRASSSLDPYGFGNVAHRPVVFVGVFGSPLALIGYTVERQTKLYHSFEDLVTINTQREKDVLVGFLTGIGDHYSTSPTTLS